MAQDGEDVNGISRNSTTDNSEASDTDKWISRLVKFLEALDNSRENDKNNVDEFRKELGRLPRGLVNTYTNDFSQETVLHIAIQQNLEWAAKILLEAGADALAPDTYGDTPFHLAADNEIQKTILDALKEDQATYDKALFWAAAKFERHEIAKKLLTWGLDSNTDGSSVIELATDPKQADLLWWLIATSPDTHEVRENIKSAQSKVEAQENEVGNDDARRPGGRRVPMRKFDKDNRDATTCADGNQSSVWRFIKDILENPQIAQVYGDSTIRRTRTIEDTVYDKGPTKIMAKAISNLNKTMEKTTNNKNNDAKAKILQDLYHEDNLRFTHIHLPTTNIDWMKDLLLRIMVDKGIKNSITANYYKVGSFLQSTWFEIPDRTSKSRIMRPHFSERTPVPSTSKRGDGGSSSNPIEEQKGIAANDVQGEKAPDNIVQVINDRGANSQETKKPETTEGEKQEDTFTPSSALYMPFLSFAAQNEDLHKYSNQDDDKKRDEPDQNPERPIKAYGDPVIYSSATLDEAYYHFDLDDTRAQDDRKEQWVISATSHPVDDVEQSWLEGFTQYLNNQIKAGGAQSQPGSTKDIMKAIVDYCTSVFLPLSFLSSLFALDADKFHDTPAWVFGVIFGISFGFGAFVIYFLYVRRYVVTTTKITPEYTKKDAKKQYDDTKGGLNGYIKKRSGSVNDEEKGLNKPTATEGQREDKGKTILGQVFNRRRRNNHQSSDI
ncbi:hypothetical protein F4814DRAFT_454316 [Daldinia grandis]|nr:hypothetical protein F4814DRAFT_454316 [Daldinia grandis]